jgi:hypothetical protein
MLDEGSVDGQMHHGMGCVIGQKPILPRPVSRKGDSVAELSFDGKFQENFFNYSPSSRENDAVRWTKR